MKRIICSLILIISISSSTAYAAERPKEFQGIIWGTPISGVEGLVLKKETLSPYLPPNILEEIKETMRQKEARGEKTYVRPTDILGVPGAEVRTIEYIFVKDQFAQGVTRFDGYEQYLNFVNISVRRYGTPDKDEIDTATINHHWYARSDDEADVTLFYGYSINASYLSMKSKAFLKTETGLLAKDRKQEDPEAGWQFFREDDDGKLFYDNDRITRPEPDKEIFRIRVKCNLSIKSQNELRFFLKSKIMPRQTTSLEEIKCSSKEIRNIEYAILSERGPLRSF